MARLREVKSWMKWWGWSETDGAMLIKRDADNIVIAHRGDAVWEFDLDKAIDLSDRYRMAAAPEVGPPTHVAR
jgi:hypothetical protein